MDKIKLNFINRSGDENNSSVVIFQQNVAESFKEIAIAWKVIENCGRLDNHPLNFKVSASDSHGNSTPLIDAFDGQALDMVKSTSEHILHVSSNPSTSPTEVEIKNNLDTD